MNYKSDSIAFTMTDANGNVINNGDKVDIINGTHKSKAIFKWISIKDTEYAEVEYLGVKFRKGGRQGYGEGCLSRYIFKAN